MQFKCFKSAIIIVPVRITKLLRRLSVYLPLIHDSDMALCSYPRKSSYLNVFENHTQSFLVLFTPLPRYNILFFFLTKKTKRNEKTFLYPKIFWNRFSEQSVYMWISVFFSFLVPKKRYIFCYSMFLLNLYSTIFVQF